jgi:aspartate carbamoyltransferase catalytic subunit
MHHDLQHDAAGRLRHLLSLDGLSRAELERLLERAARWVTPAGARTASGTSLQGRSVASLFFEPSTRTRASFGLAARRLGAEVLDFDEKESSAAKGETLEDTALNLMAMGVDAFVVRHAVAGVQARIARAVDAFGVRAGRRATVINAGEAHVSHPTQGLLDALTIRQHKGADFSRLRIAIVGDILHSRVAASATSALLTLGVGELRLVAPAGLLPPAAATRAHRVVDTLEAGIADCDVVMMLRIQKERMPSGLVPDDAAYHRQWGLTEARLALAKPDCIVMHPGPVNREVELASAVMDGPRSVILDQVANGVAVRMAVLEELLAP